MVAGRHPNRVRGLGAGQTAEDFPGLQSAERLRSYCRRPTPRLIQPGHPTGNSWPSVASGWSEAPRNWHSKFWTSVLTRFLSFLAQRTCSVLAGHPMAGTSLHSPRMPSSSCTRPKATLALNKRRIRFLKQRIDADSSGERVGWAFAEGCDPARFVSISYSCNRS